MRTALVVTLIATLALAPVASAEGGLDMIPGNAGGVLTFQNLTRFYETFEVNALRAQYPDQFEFLSGEMIEDIGVDLLNPEALSSQGFDLQRPLHVGFLVNPASVVVLIPGKESALKWVRARMEEQGAQFTKEAEQGGTKIDVGANDELACFARGGYVVIVVADEAEGGPASETAKRLIEQDGKSPITKTDRYTKVMSKLPQQSDLQFFMGSELQRHMSSMGKSDDELAEHGMSKEQLRSNFDRMGLGDVVTGMAMRLNPDGLTVDAYSWAGADSPLMGWFVVKNDPVAFIKRMPAQPWMVLLTRVNMAAMWRTMSTMWEGMPGAPDDDMFAEANAELGIDVEKDIIEQIQGNFGILIDKVMLMRQEAMVIVQVDDPARFRATLATLTEKMRSDMEKKAGDNPNGPPQSIVDDSDGDVTFYRVVMPMAQICYGVIADHMVVTTSPERFHEIVAGASGLPDAVSNAAVKTALVTPTDNVYYVDFQGLAEDARGLLPMLGPDGEKYSRILEELSELVSISRVEGDAMSQKLLLTSTSPGVWKRLLELGVQNVEVE